MALAAGGQTSGDGPFDDGPDAKLEMDEVVTSTTQAKRLALLLGPDHWWKQPLVYGLTRFDRLDVDRLRQTLLLVSRRHAGLRTVFLREGGTDRAGLLREPVWPLRVVDVSTSPPSGSDWSEEESEALGWLGRDFDPYERPLVRALLLHRSDHDLLGLGVEHSLCDGASARFLLQDVAEVYSGLEHAPAGVFDILVSDATEFAREERKWLAGAHGQIALDWWDDVSHGLGAYPELTIPTLEEPHGTEPQTFVRELSTPEIGALRAAQRELRLSSFMLAATAAAVALRHVVPEDDVKFLFANSRRTWPSTHALIAYCANRSMIRIQVGATESLSGIASKVRSSTVAALRHGMFSHEEYVHARFPEAYDRKPSSPYFHLNVHEQQPLTRLAHGWTRVALPSRPGNTAVPGVSVNVLVRPDGTGAMGVSHPTGMYPDDLAAALAHEIIEFMTRT